MQHFLQRLHEIARELARIFDRNDILTTDEKELPRHLREALQEHIAHKEAELADLFGFEAELSGLETAIACFAGGPEADVGDDANASDNEGEA